MASIRCCQPRSSTCPRRGVARSIEAFRAGGVVSDGTHTTAASLATPAGYIGAYGRPMLIRRLSGTPRSVYFAAGGCLVALAALRLPDAEAPAFVSLTDDPVIRAVLGSIPAAVLLVVLLRVQSATAMIALGLLGMLLFQPAVMGTSVFIPHTPPSVGGSIAFVAYCVVLVAGVALHRNEGTSARERQCS